MKDKQKRKIARRLLKRNGYTEAEIKKILIYAFGEPESVKDKRK